MDEEKKMAAQTEPTSPDVAEVGNGQAWRSWEGLPPDVPPDVAVGDEEREWRNWMGIAIGLVGLLSVMAIILSAFALAASSSGNNAAPTTVSGTGAPGANAGALGATTAPLAKPEAIKLAVKADDEHGRLGPDGTWHDAFLPADFTVRPGAKVTVTVANYDGGAHTFTSPSLGLNGVIPAGSMQHPHETTFTFTAPKTAGRYAWWCAMPCDPWAMAHNGYMRGYVTVAA
jgi:plastocyanin